jgi:trk system potassium uptake protein
MRAIVVGCGRAGAELANRLSRAGHNVTVIDVVADAFLNLATDFRGHVIQAEALNRDVLVNAGVESADCIATLTNSDALNAVLGHIAATVYQVPRVVVRNYDPRWLPLHAAFGLQTVSSVQWNASRFEELLTRESTQPVYSLSDGNLAIYEIVVPHAALQQKLADLIAGLPLVVAAVIQGGKGILPAPDFMLNPGDVVIVSSAGSVAEQLRQRLHTV